MGNCISLNGIWQLRAGDWTATIPCDVPGDNYTALEKARRIPDPYFGCNEARVQWPAEADWILTRSFTVTPGLFASHSVLLNFDSIDTVADIFINGKPLAHVANEFRRWRFEVKPFIKVGENELEVRIKAPAQAIRDDEKRYPHPDVISWGCNTLHQIARIRKCQCSSGWDWGISLPVSGIYGDTYLFGARTATLEYAWDAQQHTKRTVRVTLTAELKPLLTACAGDVVEVTFDFNGTTRRVKAVVPRDCGPFQASCAFTIRDPALWWPAGFGDQKLYTFTVTADGQSLTRQIGLRTIEVIREKESDGETFGFRVNGVDIFAKGANWIPCEAHPSRRTNARYAHLLESMVAANMNMVRIWGGGIYEPDFFYETCDRLGLLVWQDMMFACGVYPDDTVFQANVRAEVTHQVKRLRSHPSIALWCGDNENLSCVYVTRSHYALIDRLIRVEAEAIAAADPTRCFWPTSPCSGDREYERNFDSAYGDTHLWGVQNGDRELTGYLKRKARFVSEYGFASFPSLESVKTFAEPKDFNATSPVMDNHQKKDGATAGMFAMMSTYFRMPDGFEETLYLSQVKQAYALKTVTECWHARMPYCRGALYWQLNDWWPVSSWSTIEHSGRWKPSHYAVKRFFAPLSSSLRAEQPEGRTVVDVVWDLPGHLKGVAKITLRALADGRAVATWTRPVVMKGAGVLPLELPDFMRNEETRGHLAVNACFLTHEVTGTDAATGKSYAHIETAFLTAFKQCDLPLAEVRIAGVAKNKDGSFNITLSAKAPAFFVWLNVADDPLGRFDDNLITLLPGRRTLRYVPGTRLTITALRERLSARDLRG